jgi:hypothetical protein
MKSYCYRIVTINMFPVYLYPRHNSTVTRSINTNDDETNNKILFVIEKEKTTITKCTWWDIVFHQCSTPKK